MIFLEHSVCNFDLLLMGHKTLRMYTGQDCRNSKTCLNIAGNVGVMVYSERSCRFKTIGGI